MTHEYSLVIHDYLTLHIKAARENKNAAEISGDSKGVQFYNGQLEELHFIRKYLTDQIDLDTHTYYD